MTTRRDFLKTMTMASAGLAFGAGDVLGARASTTQRKVTDKVKIAYIGIGNRGEQIINDFARTGYGRSCGSVRCGYGSRSHPESDEPVS